VQDNFDQIVSASSSSFSTLIPATVYGQTQMPYFNDLQSFNYQDQVRRFPDTHPVVGDSDAGNENGVCHPTQGYQQALDQTPYFSQPYSTYPPMTGDIDEKLVANTRSSSTCIDGQQSFQSPAIPTVSRNCTIQFHPHENFYADLHY